MPIKKKDFVEIEYTGRVKDSGDVFDTTDAEEAKKANVFNERAEYEPIVICVGEGHVLKGIDEFLEGKDVGEFTVELPAEKAFGKKNPEFIRMIPASKFKEHKIEPAPGLNVNVDGAVGMVKTMSGGRCVVDFNHPLAGQDVSYALKVNRIVTDKKVQIEALLKVLLGIRSPEVKLEGEKAVITLPAKLPEQIESELAKKVKDLVGVEASFVEKKIEEQAKKK